MTTTYSKQSKAQIRDLWRQRIDGSDLSIVIIIYVASVLLISLVFAVIPASVIGPGVGLLAGISASALAALVSVGVCQRASDTLTWRSMGLTRVPAQRWYVFGALGGLLLPVVTVALVGLYITVVGELPPERDIPSPWFAADEIVSALLLILLGGVLGPVAEELLFRGVL